MWLNKTPTRAPIIVWGALGFFRRISPFSESRKSVATLKGKPSLSIQVTMPYLNRETLSGSTSSKVVKGRLPPEPWKYLRSSMQVSSLVPPLLLFFSRTTQIARGPQGIRQCKAPFCATWAGTVPIHGRGQNPRSWQRLGRGLRASQLHFLRGWRRGGRPSGSFSCAQSCERRVYSMLQRTWSSCCRRRIVEEK